MSNERKLCELCGLPILIWVGTGVSCPFGCTQT